MTSFVVQVSGNLPPHALERAGTVRRQTVLQATVPDQAALYGFLKVLNALGLDLLDLHRLPAGGESTPGALPRQDRSSVIGVVIGGPIGDLALSTLCDHVEVTNYATRVVLRDRAVLDEVLDWARDAGATVEYAADAPVPTDPTLVPPV